MSAILRDVFPKALENAEWKLIQERRCEVWRDAGSPAPSKDEDCRVGLALSGGGIRSATFCLGVLQHMARTGLLRTVDYLSTVSGGGYIGSFLGALFMRGRQFAVEEFNAAKQPAVAAGAAKDPPHVHVEKLLGSNFSTVIRWLRENGRHLAPNGAGDLLTALAVQLRNWFSVVAVMGISLLTIFLGTQLLRLVVDRIGSLSFLSAMLRIPQADLWLSPWLMPAFAAAAVTVMFGWAYWLISKPSDRAGRHISKWATLAVLILSAWLGLRQEDYVAGVFKGFLGIGLGASLLSMLGWIVGVFSIELQRSKQGLGRRRELLSRALHSMVRARPSNGRLELWRLLRNRCSVNLKISMIVAAWLLAFALIDTLGQSLYLAFTRGTHLQVLLKGIWGASCLALLLSFGDRILAWIERFRGGKKIKPSLSLIALTAGTSKIAPCMSSCAAVCRTPSAAIAERIWITALPILPILSGKRG